MRIGIDLDDTLVSTAKTIKKIIKDNNYDLNTADYRKWSENKKYNFFAKHAEELFLNGVINDHALDVIDKLKKDGHELWIVTARNNIYSDIVITSSKKFIENNNLNIDKACFGISPKGKFCADNNIDILIDDSPYQYQSVIDNGKKAILFNSEFNQGNNFIRANNWLEVYDIIKEMEA